MATKGGREKIKLESTAGTGHFYTTSKNKKTMPEKMLIKKFDPKARKHVDYKEMKLKYFCCCHEKARLMRAFCCWRGYWPWLKGGAWHFGPKPRALEPGRPC